MEFLALQELHEAHLTLVEGSAFSERDLLHRAGLPASLGAMVLADRWGVCRTAGVTACTVCRRQGLVEGWGSGWYACALLG